MKYSFSDALAAIPTDPTTVLATDERNDSGDPEVVQLIVRVPPETRRALKRLATDNDSFVQTLMEEAITDLFIKYRVPPPS